MKEYIAKGYTRKLTPEEAAVTDPRTWYLPHFPVLNPNNPGKVLLTIIIIIIIITITIAIFYSFTGR